MSLNVANYTSRINTQSIDVQAVKDITSQILNAPEKKAVDLDSLNLSKFNRVDQGLDLYSRSTSAQQATQIAVRNADIDVNLNNQNFLTNLQYLNSQAAVSAHKTTQQVDGKIIVPLTEDNQVNLREVFSLPKAAQLFESQNLNKDKRGSNPFSYQKPAANKKDSQSVESLSIFA